MHTRLWVLVFVLVSICKTRLVSSCVYNTPGFCYLLSSFLHKQGVELTTAWETNTIVLYVYYVYVCRWLRICICLLIRIMYCIRIRILQECNRLQRRLAPFFARSLALLLLFCKPRQSGENFMLQLLSRS